MRTLAVGEPHQRETAMTKSNLFEGAEFYVSTIGPNDDICGREFDTMKDMMSYLRRVGAMPGGRPRKAAPHALVSVFIVGPNGHFSMSPT
jgi:hypothetical protein